MLGIGYRRVPILAIGNDVYCDTSLISSVIDRHFPENQGFPALFPQRKDGGKADTGMIKAFCTFYVDRPLFNLASSSLPYKKFTAEFIEDRGKWFGAPVDIEVMTSRQPAIKSLLSSHMSLLEEQLADGREWVFDTVAVGYGDISIYAVYGWVIRFRGMREVLIEDKFPNSIAWMGRMADLVKAKREANAPVINKIQGDAAAKIIASAGLQSTEIGFDEEEAGRLGLQHGLLVSVAPDDNATNYPTIGKLTGLNREEFILEVSGTAVSSLRCHFPRFNFSARVVREANSKL
ncbi:hypothetical protein EW145_g458 [Phellinidium pouzarii]|uniref:DUF7962 domain-containing protein n=1 Tax=Phellinidium pouzarii TaxID=167371 RepID=A0A4S4LIF3_9AGAM|nr:hypothetical protein EW145_g458 [Phellinidium pouzarii]